MGSGKYAMEGKASGELLSFRGAVLWHNNPHELRYLFAKNFESGALRVIELPKTDLGRPLMRLQDHPDMLAVSFPLRLSEFRPVQEMQEGAKR